MRILIRQCCLGALLVLLVPFAHAQEAPSSLPGYLVLSIGPVLTTSPASVFLDYAGAGDKVDKEAEWLDIAPAPNDYDNNGDRGFVYVRALPAGQYHFYRFTENDGYVIYAWRLSIPFTITPGHVTYAGDFRFVAQQARGLFGMPVQRRGYLVVSNESSRDIPIAAKNGKIANLTDLPLDVVSLDRAMLNLPPFCMLKKPDVVTPDTDPPVCPPPDAKHQ